MKWLQDNPLGMALVAISGLLALLVLAMTVIWTLPVTVETTEVESQENADKDSVLAAHQVAVLGTFQVINEKPLFNALRLPEIEETDDEPSPDDTVAVKDAPDVRLTGVVITPSMKIASFTPADGKLEKVMAHEGESLTGEFVGWLVSAVNPRTVVLESRNGQKLELDLQVHDSKIKEPPKPAKPVKVAQSATGQGEPAAGEDGEPLSRAEQIRQRIAERREELRLEQEEQQTQNGSRAAKTNDYQSAIRAMMKKNSKDKGSNDNKDG